MKETRYPTIETARERARETFRGATRETISYSRFGSRNVDYTPIMNYVPITENIKKDDTNLILKNVYVRLEKLISVPNEGAK